MEDQELREILGEDLHDVLRARQVPGVSVSPISPLSSGSWARAAFRIDLADGSSIKGRRLESAAAAEGAVRLERFLPEGPFSRILAQHGCALLCEWIDGEVLSSCEITNDHLRRAGEILRSIHAVTLPKALATNRYPPPGWREDLAGKIGWLCAEGELEQLEGDQAIDLADAHAPTDVEVTLVHGDMCPENLVVDIQGALRVVDNDGVDRHAPAFDLARTWYRWPMTDPERRAFEKGYAAKRGLESYREHFAHWAVVVLIGAMEFRLRQQLPVWEPYLRLRELLRDDAGCGWDVTKRGC